MLDGASNIAASAVVPTTGDQDTDSRTGLEREGQRETCDGAVGTSKRIDTNN